eukprot:1159696-Pelagomonas_calceolata.AAC.13
MVTTVAMAGDLQPGRLAGQHSNCSQKPGFRFANKLVLTYYGFKFVFILTWIHTVSAEHKAILPNMEALISFNASSTEEEHGRLMYKTEMSTSRHECKHAHWRAFVTTTSKKKLMKT